MQYSINIVSKMRRFNFKLIARLLGVLLLVLSVSAALPFAIACYYHDGSEYAFLNSIIVYCVSGLFLRNVVGKNVSYQIGERESFWITGLAWILIPIAGTLPFVLTGVAPTYCDALFESFSGFTTTGSSVIPNMAEVPKGILVWRSTTQWIGGLGLMLFIIAFAKVDNVGAKQLYEAEFSGTIQRKLHPHIAKSVTLMWNIYGGLTILLLILLFCFGNNLVDSLCLTLSTVSTGGFIPFADGFNSCSSATLIVITVFMFISGINIALIYNLTRGHVRQLWKDEEFRLYGLLFILCTLVAVGALVMVGNTVSESIGFAFFHIASTLSTCGFSMEAPAHWPIVLSVVTLILMFIGASAGSTGGGIKIKRLMLMFKYFQNYLLRMLHPNAVRTVKINHEIIPADYIGKIFAFVFLYICFCIGGAFVLTLSGINIPNAICMAAANLGNLGPSPLLNTLGGSCDYLSLSYLSKSVLMVLMVAGRVEIFALIAIFSPAYWNRQ